MKNDQKKFDIINYSLMALLCVVILYPVWYVVVLSLNDGADAAKGGIYLWMRKFTIENITFVLSNKGILQGFLISVLRTTVGAFTHVLFTAAVAYAISKNKLFGRKFWIGMGVVTMFFNGGLIPTFLLIKNLGLLNNFWVYIIPSLFNFFELIIFVSFFRELPPSLEESAFLDGANDFQIFYKLVLPLSMPVLATITLFNGVWHWNDFFTGLIYINDEKLQPIQTYLYKVIAQNSSSQMLASSGAGVARATTSKSIELATMVVTTIPIVCVYPFLQKYFVKGMMVGSVKG